MISRRAVLQTGLGGMMVTAMTAEPTPAAGTDGSFALALGGGAAKGFAHIPMLEALDELGAKPSRIAGTSMGAIIGVSYAAGFTGKEIRERALALLGDRTELIGRLLSDDSGGWPSLFSWTSPALISAETLVKVILPDGLPDNIEQLAIPTSIIATDFHNQQQVVLSEGSLQSAVAASSALPVLMKPVARKGQVLIDGGFVNPTPFDILEGSASRVIAVDVTGKQHSDSTDVPGPLETWVGSFHIVLHSLVNEKLRHKAPDLLVRPAISHFDTMDFFKIDEILTAADASKDGFKRQVEALLNGKPIDL